MISLLVGCSIAGAPTYPYGGEYDGGYGGGYDGGYDGDPYKPPDYDPYDFAREIEGTWEGFMWENYRSDHAPLGKKPMAVRITRAGINLVKVNVLVDGRPAGSDSSNVSPGGCIGVSTDDCRLSGCFGSSSANGNVDLDWDEKIKNQYTGDVETYHVHISGTYTLGLTRGSQWDAAFELFDTYGDGIWDLPDDVWEEASREGLAHLAAIEDTFLRAPIE